MDLVPIDFESIISLDSGIVDLLNQYLDEKEAILSEELLQNLSFLQERFLEPSSSLKLSTALERIEKSDFHSAEASKFDSTSFKEALLKINASIWIYVETLEGIVHELSGQLETISLEQWHDKLAEVVISLKELLIHKLEDLIWAIRRLETQLWRIHHIEQANGSPFHLFEKIRQWFFPLLDKSLIPTLKKNQEFLRLQYQKFFKRYKGYLTLQAQVDPHIEKAASYKVLASLGRPGNQQIVKLYMLLKLLEFNRSSRALPSRELYAALRNVLSIDRATELFKEYYKLLRKKLFAESLAMKQQAEFILENDEERTRLVQEMTEHLVEVNFLGALVNHYREFLLRIDPDPYVRTRLGFREATAGEEPQYTKPLLTLGYQVEFIRDLFDKLIQSIKKTESLSENPLNGANEQIQQLLHEMGQPLSSARSLRQKAELILEQLNELNELGSFCSKTILFTEKVLSNLLRVDWRYHVACGIPLFHQLYEVHQGLMKPTSSRQHHNRINHLTALLNRITEWIKPQNIRMHEHDIELDINDIKSYLQDFLGSMQQSLNDENLANFPSTKLEPLRQEFRQQLLEYRYLFGNFFYQLRQNEYFGPNIRRQFLFVDQYFESAEQRLHDLE